MGVSGAAKSAAGCCGNVCAGFKEFLLRGNVVDLAVAVVVGGAFKELINAFVAAFITPLLGMIGTAGANGLSFTVNGSKFEYGLFINAFISFIIICTVVFFFVVLPLMGLMNKLFPLRVCPECFSLNVPAQATRCPFCCASIEPALVKKKNAAGDEVITKNPDVVMSSGGGGAGGAAVVV